MNTESGNKIKDLIGSLQKELVDHLPAITHSTRSRLLRIYDVWRQVNLRRTIDLSEGAADFFEKGSEVGWVEQRETQRPNSFKSDNS